MAARGSYADVFEAPGSGALAGQRVGVLGRLAGMTQREARGLIRKHGGEPIEGGSDAPDLLVVGEASTWIRDGGDVVSIADEQLQRRVEQGELTVITETQLWQRLGFVEGEQEARRLYTPAMLADLVGVDVSIIRRWHRRGLIVPLRMVHKLPYFDFEEVVSARRLAELLSAGVSAQAIEKKLASVARVLPDVERPLAQLSAIVEGKELLLRQGEGLLEPGGQRRFDFEAASERAAGSTALESLPAERVAADHPADDPPTIDEMLSLAMELDDAGDLEEAAELYLSAMAAGGPRSEICFLLGEVRYRQGELGAARERFHMAVELDEDYVEARANLGCVLAELSSPDLAIAAFEGALAHHRDYPDVHYHLARALDEAGRVREATAHWEEFVELAPESPWSDEARERLSASCESVD